MEQYKTEIEYCNRMGYHPNDAEEKMQLVKMFSEFKTYLIEQAKKDKLTYSDCLDVVAQTNDQNSFSEMFYNYSDRGYGYEEITEHYREAAEMYNNQFIPVAPAEKILKCMDCCHEFKYSELVTVKRRRKCPSCGSVHYDIIESTPSTKQP